MSTAETQTTVRTLPSDQNASGRTLGTEEIAALVAAIESGTLTSTKGQFVKQFEQSFADGLGMAHGYACSSGTAALHTAIAAIDPEPGDEIIATPITDMGALTPMLYQGAIPVFADVDPRTYNLTAETIEQRLSHRTKAIMVTHLFGNPCPMHEIMELARHRGISVIEDCAQAFGATVDGKYVGTIGDIGCFSLQQGKHITTGEGGVVVTNNSDLARRSFLFINKAWGYGDENPDHYFLALNYRMNELSGAVALAQLDKLDASISQRVALAELMTEKLANIDGVGLPAVADNAVATFWKYALDVDPDIIDGGTVAMATELKSHGIFSAPRYIQKPAFQCAVFKEQRTFGRSQFPFTLALKDASTTTRPGTRARLPLCLACSCCRGTNAIPREMSITLRPTFAPRPAGCASVLDRRPWHRSANTLKTIERSPVSEHSPLRFGMVGAGAIAQTYVQAFTNSGKAELVAVADLRQEAADAIASSLSIRSFSQYETMFDEMDLDAVVVCTPPVTHEPICLAACQRQLHVLCEKPLALNGESARCIVAAAEQAGVRFTMASKFRYVQDVIKAKSIVESGILGDLILFENTFAGHVDMRSRWNSDTAVSGGGVLIDNGTHSVDIIRYFVGPVAEVQAVEGKRIQELPVEDTVRMFVRSETGVMGSVDLSWSFNKNSPDYISIYGNLGTILVGWQESKYRRSTDQEWIVFGNGYNKFDAFTSQIDNFCDAIHGEDGLLIKPADAIASVDVIEVAYDAMQRNSWLPVNGQTVGV